jgi:uncharacterized protein YjlB
LRGNRRLAQPIEKAWEPRFEALATEIARGNAIVRFGGDKVQEIAIAAGDVAILPASTGHQCLTASPDFSMVGAYPPGAKMQVTRPTPENHARALKTIRK